MAVKSSRDEIVWEVITNHTVPETKKEVSDKRKKQMKELGYKNMKMLLEAEKFDDPEQFPMMERQIQPLPFDQKILISVRFLQSCGY